MSYKRSSILFEEAYKYIPSGGNYFKSVGGTPVFMKSAKGAYVTDEDENTYIDYDNFGGAAILGHSHPEITEAVKMQAENGFSFGISTELEIEISKLIVENVPNIGQIRMVSSATEACINVIRLARGFTKREKIIRFEGFFHGSSDVFLPRIGNGGAVYGNPYSSGITEGTAKDTLTVEYNDFEKVEDFFKANPEQISAIIVEPIAGSTGCILPENQFIQNLRKICDKNGALLIFDETKTGFRLAFGGAQESLETEADIVIFGEIIGGGLSAGAFGARKEIMNELAPAGAVFQSGMCANPLALSAGFKTLQLIKSDENFYNKINKTAETLDFEIGKILNEKGIRHRINRKGSMMSIFFGVSSVSNFKEAQDSNVGLFNNFFHQLLENGIYLPPNGCASWFVSSAIGDSEIDKTLEAVRKFEY